jgi:uncharacterized protein YuzE
MTTKQKIEFTVSPSGEVAYLQLPIAKGCVRKVAKNLRLHDLINGYCGPDIIFDFDRNGRLIGIEILS